MALFKKVLSFDQSETVALFGHCYIVVSNEYPTPEV
jgi:hypothetical protein